MKLPVYMDHHATTPVDPRFTTEEEVDYVRARVVEAVRSLRELSPEYAAAKSATTG